MSQMGDADGGSPGRMVRLGPAPGFAVVGEYPAAPPPDFNPHGFAIDATRQRMITAGALAGYPLFECGGVGSLYGW